MRLFNNNQMNGLFKWMRFVSAIDGCFGGGRPNERKKTHNNNTDDDDEKKNIFGYAAFAFDSEKALHIPNQLLQPQQ